LLLALCAAAFSLAACTDDENNAPSGLNPTPTPVLPQGDTVCVEPELVAGLPPAGNQFANGSFEEGHAPWCSLESEAWGEPFTVSQAQAQEGGNSAYLAMRTINPNVSLSSRVFGLTTEVAPVEFPERLSGYYYVDSWQPGTDKVYMQAVAIVFGPDNIEPADLPNYQIRYILGGLDAEPFEIANGKFDFSNVQSFGGGRWIRFDIDLRDDFEELWGAVPENYESIRVLFEVRWDDANFLREGPSTADVYYDNLYLGPADAAPAAEAPPPP
jgi:hypothetical protein